MNKEKINATRSSREDGAQILKHYTILQLVTRLTYERRKRKLHWTLW